MLTSDKIQPAIEDIVTQLEHCGIREVEIGLLNLGDARTPLQDRADGRGYQVYVRLNHQNEPDYKINVPYVDSLSAFINLRARLREKGINYSVGTYQHLLSIP